MTTTVAPPDFAPETLETILDRLRSSIAPTLSPLIDVKVVAALLDCSVRHVWRLNDSALMPIALKLGSLKKWRRADILAWIEGGCKPCRR